MQTARGIPPQLGGHQNEHASFEDAGAASLAFAAGAAHATTYEVKFSDGPVAGDFLATAPAGVVTSISGWVSDSELGAGSFAITGLSGYASADQQLSGTFPYVDFSGLAFSTGTGGDFSFADAGGGQLYLVSSTLDPAGVVQAQGNYLINPTVTAVPEPASLGLLVAGLGMIGVVSSRRRAR